MVAGTRALPGADAETDRFLQALERCRGNETIVLAALKDRLEDVESLAVHFLAQFARFEDPYFSKEALGALLTYDWPNGVGELEQAVFAACHSAEGPEIRQTDLPAPLERLRGTAPLQEKGAERRSPSSTALEHEIGALRNRLDTTVSLLEAYERGALTHAMSLTGGDKLAAARLLQIGKSTFYRKLKQHGLS